MKFTWNEDKAWKVKDEHRVEFDKIKDIFDDPFAVEFTDEAHYDRNGSQICHYRFNCRIRLDSFGFQGSFGNSLAFHNGEKSRKLDG